MKEIWKTAVIDGKENKRYKVSNYGRIICLNWNRTGKPRLCKLSVDGRGYVQVNIDNLIKKVHRIVAETFIPNPEGKKEVDHINTVKTDNIVLLDDDGKTILYTNLRWASRLENCNNSLTKKHISENQWCRGKFGAEHHNSIPIVQLTLDGKFIKKWSCGREIQRELGINQSSIIQCCKGKIKSAGGYRWMYYSDYQKLQRKTIKDIKPLF
ncbi:MAG: HNH endonuclease [Bacteroidales bacterium]|nr:HNH endonuclease [Bacteroidales bacterium]